MVRSHLRMSRTELLVALAAAGQRHAATKAELQRALLAAADHASLAEMGAALGVPRQTVRGRIRAARRAAAGEAEET